MTREEIQRAETAPIRRKRHSSPQRRAIRVVPMPIVIPDEAGALHRHWLRTPPVVKGETRCAS
jgi:hypothetical protein